MKIRIYVLLVMLMAGVCKAQDKPASSEQMSAVIDEAVKVASSAADFINEQKAMADTLTKIEAEVAEFAKVKQRLEAENAALRAALESKVGKTEAQLIDEANAANIRAAKAEGELRKIKAQLEADPFAGAPKSAAYDPATDPFVAPAPKPKQWREVVRFTRPADTTTEPFIISAAEWRVRWMARGDATLYVHTPGRGGYVATFDGDKSGAISSGMVYEGAGRYYLATIGANEGWSAVIEELR